MRKIKVNLISLTTLACLLIASCSTSPTKKAIQSEAEKQAQIWFDGSFAKCNDGFYAKYKGDKIAIGFSVLSMTEGYLHFKDLNYVVEEQPLTEADKLNGIEWKGVVIVTPEPTLRYYNLGSSFSKQWSEWKQEMIIYNKGNAFSLDKTPGSPLLQSFRKVKGKWVGFTNELIKLQCSDIPL